MSQGKAASTRDNRFVTPEPRRNPRNRALPPRTKPWRPRAQRGVIADWLVKIVIGVAVFGVIGYDAGSILVNFFTLDGAADDVAVAVSTDVGTRSAASQWTDKEILDAAREAIELEGGMAGARVIPKGTFVDDEGVVHIRMRRRADTLIVGRIGAIEDWARATTDSVAGTT